MQHDREMAAGSELDFDENGSTSVSFESPLEPVVLSPFRSAIGIWLACSAGAGGGELSNNIESSCKMIGLNSVMPNEAVADWI